MENMKQLFDLYNEYLDNRYSKRLMCEGEDDIEEQKKDIRVYRFTTTVGIPGDKEVRAINPVPVYTDNHKLIGFATITCPDLPGKMAVANVAIDPNNPEAFDLEVVGRKYWMDAFVEYRGMSSSRVPTVYYIKGLILTTDPIEGLNPIDLSGMVFG